MKLGNHNYRAIKYNLYNGYELVYSEHVSLYSRTISLGTAFRLFSAELLEKAANNFEIIQSPYYGTMQRWLETAI